MEFGGTFYRKENKRLIFINFCLKVVILRLIKIIFKILLSTSYVLTVQQMQSIPFFCTLGSPKQTNGVYIQFYPRKSFQMMGSESFELVFAPLGGGGGGRGFPVNY